ncbi:MAG: glycosyltransferase family 4 protein [Succinivibrionaceae bacterium]|nr:glycosyltransferase family 4 protein [Succinivibrionaceae bacterium]
MVLRIAHANFARGYRGGERQTEILIRELSKRDDVEQTLFTGHSSELAARLAGTKGLRIAETSRLGGHLRGGFDVLQAHEAKAAHWAYLEHLAHGEPYVITRRVPEKIRESFFNLRVYRNAACTVGLSSVICDELRSFPGVREVRRIPSSCYHLDHDDKAAAAIREKYHGRFLVAQVGALVDRHKGQRVLLEAARILRDRCPDMLFLFLGSGADESVLLEVSRGLDNVIWLGFQKNVGDYLAAVDVMAYPSRIEGLGSAILDAMDFGVPVIAARVGGIPDIIRSGSNGILFESGDAAALADGLERLRNDAALRESLAGQARADLSAFSPEAMAGSYLALYRDICGAGKG